MAAPSPAAPAPSELVALSIAAASHLSIERATSAVLLPGEKMPEGTPTVRGSVARCVVPCAIAP